MLTDTLITREQKVTHATMPDWCAPWVDDLRKRPEDNKYSHGHALVLSGGPNKGGAARLAALGALRIGAGLITIGCPLRATLEHASQLNAIMLAPIDGPPGLTELLDDERINSVCVGPGLGLGVQTHDFVMAALRSRRAVTIDADALSRFERNPDDLFANLHDKCVLTPHAGEFRRVFPDLADRDESKGSMDRNTKIEQTHLAAKRAGCTILFKGAISVIANPQGDVFVIEAKGENAAPWLATAGSGDVLAGFATGLMARGWPATRAAGMAAWLHLACAVRFGPGLIAEDIPSELPKVLFELGV